MNMFDKFFKKEAPILGILGLAGGIARSAGGGATPITATGGTKITAPDGIYHIFGSPYGSPQPFNISAGTLGFEVLVVGGGGSSQRGGGGGGGVRFETYAEDSYTAPVTYTVVVGAGGPGSSQTNGSDSNWDTGGTPVPAGGGGAGGGPAGNAHTGSNVGGSGGGGSSGPPDYRSPGARSPSGSPTPWAAGYAGGGGGGPDFGAGNAGGGGAGGAGAAAAATSPYPGTMDSGPGGNGGQVPAPFLPTNAPSPTQTSLGGIPTSDPAWRYFAGGGSGGWAPAPQGRWTPTSGSPIAGGLGGGGIGGHIGASGGDGVDGRGGGGGGSGNDSYNAGGDGIIIVRYDA